MKATADVFAKVEDARFRKAVDAVRGGFYHVSVTLRNEEEVRGVVTTADGKAYGCTLTPVGSFCSCPDALYRGAICKHAVALALHAVRDPAPSKPFADESQPVTRPSAPPDLSLTKIRRGFAFSP